jgi:hypothetical protein
MVASSDSATLTLWSGARPVVYFRLAGHSCKNPAFQNKVGVVLLTTADYPLGLLIELIISLPIN